MRRGYVSNADVSLEIWGLNFWIMEKNVDGILQNINIVLGDNVDGDTKSSVNEVMGALKVFSGGVGKYKRRHRAYPERLSTSKK